MKVNPQKNNTMLPKSVLFTEDQMKYMQELKEKAGVCPSQLIRIALDNEIERRKAKDS